MDIFDFESNETEFNESENSFFVKIVNYFSAHSEFAGLGLKLLRYDQEKVSIVSSNFGLLQFLS